MNWPGLRFDDDEYRARHERLREAMLASGLDALVLSDDRHTWYATGFGEAGPIGSAARPRVVVIPLAGPPVFFIHRSTLVTVSEMSAVEDIRTYDDLGCIPAAAIALLLRERGARRVGAELGGGMRVGTTVNDVDSLREAIGGLEDASAVLWAVRAQKSPAEAARIREACEITSAAYADVLPRLTEGMTEREIAGRLRSAMSARGADGTWVWVVSGRGEYDRVDGVSRERPVERGELVFVDMGACLGGYWADFSRSAVIGRASEHQLRLQGLIAEVTTIGAQALVPGRTTSDVARLVDGAMAERELEFSSRAGRYGHGLGMVVTEYPDVAAAPSVMIEPGMVLTMEPGMWTHEGMFHCEHNVLVTPEGNDVLSLAPLELTETD